MFGTGFGGAGALNLGGLINVTTFAAGAIIFENMIINGDFTAYADFSDTDGSTSRLNISFTVSNGGNSIDITSATVTIAGSLTAEQDLLTSTSRSQITVIKNNIMGISKNTLHQPLSYRIHAT